MAYVDVTKWREKNGYSQSQLARALEVNVMTISRWEREVRSAPAFLHLALEALAARKKLVKSRPKK